MCGGGLGLGVFGLAFLCVFLVVVFFLHHHIGDLFLQLMPA